MFLDRDVLAAELVGLADAAEQTGGPHETHGRYGRAPCAEGFLGFWPTVIGAEGADPRDTSAADPGCSTTGCPREVGAGEPAAGEHGELALVYDRIR